MIELIQEGINFPLLRLYFPLGSRCFEINVDPCDYPLRILETKWSFFAGLLRVPFF